MSDSSPDILFKVEGGVAEVVLNRPQALNALTLDMVRELTPRIAAWAADPSIHLLIMTGAGDRAFCAGGDIRALYDSRGTDSTFGVDFFREEYRLDQMIKRFGKPQVSLWRGVAMGGGVGISVHGRYRVATERCVFAMPEVGIGFFPDVGGSYFLPRLRDATGTYLALTGARADAADCLHAGIATHAVPEARIDDLVAALRATTAADQVGPVLDRHAGDLGDSQLAAHGDDIERCFARASVCDIVDALDVEDSDWARRALERVRRASPTSVSVAFRQVCEGRDLDFEDCLIMEYRISQQMMATSDFFEGVRALVIDKDGAPSWKPARVEDVKNGAINRYFEPLGDKDLSFS